MAHDQTKLLLQIISYENDIFLLIKLLYCTARTLNHILISLKCDKTNCNFSFKYA